MLSSRILDFNRVPNERDVSSPSLLGTYSTLETLTLCFLIAPLALECPTLFARDLIGSGLP